MSIVRKSAGGVVLSAQGKVLIVNQNGNSWSLPKGHLDPGESALEAAMREIYEEAGIDELSLIRELGTYERAKIGLRGGDDRNERKQITLYLFRTTQLDLKPMDARNPEARWVCREEVAAYLTHPKDKEFFTSILSSLPDK